MPYLVDIYALAAERSANTVERFLAQFLPERERAEAEYSVQLGSEELAAVFDTPEEMFAFCEARPEADARAYWRNRTAGEPHSAHVFFLPDGGLVLGLSVADCEEVSLDHWLEQLLAFAGTEHGYWTGECPPENTLAELIAMAQRHIQ